MRYFKNAAFLLLGLFILLSCKKQEEAVIVPTNLMITTNISADGSGTVVFTASADNAVSYEYDFGNGNYQTVVSGNVTYQYPAPGTYTVTVTAKSSSGKTISESKSFTVVMQTSLIWSDEFNTAGPPDNSKWGYDIGANNGWGNNEKEYYTNRPDNAVVSNGTLKIILKKENYSGSAYTSARMLTKGKFSFKYGRIEVRAKLPAGKGTWPAIWMLGDNISTVSWPACGEIDIMEHVGNQLNKIFSTMHYPKNSGADGVGGYVMNPTATTEFHVYKCEWSAATLKFFVDDIPYYTFNNTSTMPFNQNFFIIMNVAMGGNFGGAVDPAFTSGEMEIDYVRVFN